MSDTVDAAPTGAPDGGDAPAVDPITTSTEPTSEPQAAGAGQDPPEAKPAPKDDADPVAMRISRLTGRLGMLMRERDEALHRAAQLEAAQRSPQDIDRDAAIRAEAQRLVAEQRTQERVEAFHEAGRERFGATNWRERCEALMAMGADAQLSTLLVEMKDGPAVAAALHDDPDELERIARLSTPTARAVALGVYAGRLEAAGNGSRGPTGSGATSGRTVSRAPAPIRPVQGRAAPVFDEYRAGNTADGNAALVEYYARQERIKRGLPA